MDYKINVSLHGKYYFSTEAKAGFSFAVGLFEHFKEIFPTSSGYEVVVVGITVESEELRSTKK